MGRFFAKSLVISAIFLVNIVFAADIVLPIPETGEIPNDTLQQPILPMPKVSGDPIAEHRVDQTTGKYAQYAYRQSVNRSLSGLGVRELPAPLALPQAPRTLSLNEAIALALRYNPSVKSAELQRILDKFSLEIVKQAYGVVWNPLTLTSTIQNKAAPVWTAGAGIGVTAPTGTAVTLTHANNLLGGNAGVNTLKITQHLMKGFGTAVNGINFHNGIDNEMIARLTFKGSVMDTVVAVIKAYRSLVSAYNSLDASKATLASTEQQVKITKLQIEAGKSSPNDLVQQQVSLENYRLSVVSQENALRQAYQSFLASIGLISSANILIDRDIDAKKEKIPSLKRCVALALKHNINYQKAVINLRITKRALTTAEDARKWTLDMTSSVQLGTQRATANGPLVSQDTNPTLGFSLSVPIDDISSKKGVVSAKISIENAELALEQQKENLIRDVETNRSSIENQYEQIVIAEKQIQYQQKALDTTKLQLKYGAASIFQKNTYENDLLDQRIQLIDTQISYLNALTDFYRQLGLTLRRRKITLRY